MRIVTLATCHNRREKTLNALADLHSQVLPESVSVEHVIVDDGSTDGTSEAVAEQFPDVEIVPGTGGLFWAGGMRYGWEQAVRGKVFDYLLVYNDDVRLELDALSRLMEASGRFVADGGGVDHVVVAAFCGKNGKTSYSGLVRSSRWHPLRFEQVDPPEEGYREVDTLNMNACLMRHEALERAGFLSDYFVHGGADFEYGVKLKKAGGRIFLVAGYVGVCERNEEQDQYMASSSSLLDCYRRLLDFRKQPVSQRFKYYSRHGGVLWL